MTLQGILFDFNGTLFFDSEMHLAAFREMFRRAGLPALSDEDMIHRMFGRNNERICREQFIPDAGPDEVAAFARDKEALYQSFCLQMPERLHLVAGAPEMLDHLRATGVPFCLATGSGLENIVFYREHLGLDRWFSPDRIVCFDGSFPGKPAPDIYRIAAARLGLAPADCMVLEDGTSGLRAAAAAGAGALAALWEARFPSPVTDGMHVDRELHDLQGWKELLADYGLLR